MDSRQAPVFQLLETMKWAEGEYVLIDEHLERLAHSAQYFGIGLAVGEVQKRLERYMASFDSEMSEAKMIRLLVSLTGEIHIEDRPLPKVPPGQRPVVLASSPISRENQFLYHKTTHRAFYEEHRAQHPDVFDTLLYNEGNELTEFTIGNLVVELDHKRYTPPVESGLLPGTFRRHLLMLGKIEERVLTKEDLAHVTRMWLINSVRGWVEVRLEA